MKFTISRSPRGALVSIVCYEDPAEYGPFTGIADGTWLLCSAARGSSSSASALAFVFVLVDPRHPYVAGTLLDRRTIPFSSFFLILLTPFAIG